MELKNEVEEKGAISQEKQIRAVAFVNRLKHQYGAECSTRKQKLTELYQDVMSYTGVKKQEWSSTLKVNFLNQIETLVTARLVRKSPKFLVSLRQEEDKILERYFKPTAEDPEEKERQRDMFKKEIGEWSLAIQDYLNTTFEEYDFKSSIRNIAKGLVRYGNTYATVSYKREKYISLVGGKREEKEVREYPYLEYVPFSELFFDPRYKKIEDGPAVIWEHSKVRLSDLYLFKDELINLDKVEYAGSNTTPNQYKQQIYQILIPNAVTGTDAWEKCSDLTVDKFYGYFSESGDPKDECLYEIWILNGALVLKMKKINKIPVRSATNFEDPEQHFGIGYVEPVKALQDEYNFKLNSATEFVNFALNRNWIWDPNSGVDPKQLSNLGPGALIVANQGIENAYNGLKELPTREISSAYFAMNNETRRDMQALSFTVDTTATTQSQGFTNTATAVRARFYENNTVYADTLEQLENLITRLAYDMLDEIAHKALNDVVVRKLGETRFKFLDKKIFEDAPLRYMIRVEVGSSSFDSIESRREDALAFWTVLKEAKQMGVDINDKKALEDVINTFEKRSASQYVKNEFPELSQLVGNNKITKREIDQIINKEEPDVSNPEELSKEITGSLL